MEELIKSFLNTMKDRATSPFYGTFIFSILAWNWELFYVVLFQNENKLYGLKIDYIRSEFILSHQWWEHLYSFIVLPAISTFLIIFIFPYISIVLHEQHKKTHYQRKIVSVIARLRYEKKRLEVEQEILKVKGARKKTQKGIKNTQTKNEIYLEEYTTFEKHKLFTKFDQVNTAIYSY